MSVLGDYLFCLCSSRKLGTKICMAGVSVRAQIFLALLVVVGPSFLVVFALVVFLPHCLCRTHTCTRHLPQSLLILSIVCQVVLLLIPSNCRQSSILSLALLVTPLLFFLKSIVQCSAHHLIVLVREVLYVVVRGHASTSVLL